MTTLMVALGAAVGAPLRFWLSTRFDTDRFPRGTLTANVVGSLLLGLLAGAAVDGAWLALLGVGFCGGFTTYSAFAVQTRRLGTTRGTAYAGVTIVAGVAAAFVGFALGQA